MDMIKQVYQILLQLVDMYLLYMRKSPCFPLTHQSRIDYHVTPQNTRTRAKMCQTLTMPCMNGASLACHQKSSATLTHGPYSPALRWCIPFSAQIGGCLNTSLWEKCWLKKELNYFYLNCIACQTSHWVNQPTNRTYVTHRPMGWAPVSDRYLVSDYPSSTQPYNFKVEYHHKTTLHMDYHCECVCSVVTWRYSTLKM